MDRSWDDTFEFLLLVASFHCMCFSCSSLAVSEDGSIVTLQDTFNDGKGCIIEDGLLLTIGPKCRIESEVSNWTAMIFLWVRILNAYCSGSFIHFYHQPMIFFFLIGWPASYDDLHSFSFSCDLRHIFKNEYKIYSSMIVMHLNLSYKVKFLH